MPKTSFQKRRILALRDLLLERTDENHYITIDEIISVLAADGLDAEKRTIMEDIETLYDAGMDIRRDEEVKVLSYAVVSRDFEIEEIRLLLDCVQTSKFLTQEMAASLSDSLYRLCSKQEAAQLREQVHRIRVRAGGGAFRVIDTLHKAISARKALSFQYMEYLPNKEKRPRQNGKIYHVYPFALVYAEEDYYLIAHEVGAYVGEPEKIRSYYAAGGNIKPFRVGLMDKAHFTKEDEWSAEDKKDFERVMKLSKPFDVGAYIRQHFSMNGGKVERVTMQFPNHLAGAVFDRFGLDVHIKQAGKGYFQITESIAVSPQFYGWLFGLGKEVKIIEPQEVAQEMKALLKDTYAFYTVKRNRKKKSESSQ